MIEIAKKETIKMEVTKKKFRRYRFADFSKRVIFIDFRCIRSVPYKPVDYGSRSRIKWNSPAHLQGLVNEYFASCEGVIYNPRTGLPFMNEDGTPRVGLIKPYTVSGLACYIHIDTTSIKEYSREKIDDLGYPTDEDYCGPQYSEIILEARKKIEAFAEERLYDRDGFNGGKFVLNCAFGWQDRLEQANIRNMEESRKIKKKELKLRREILAGDSAGEEPVTINIVRATKKEE